MSWKAWVIVLLIGIAALVGLWGDLHNVITLPALPAAPPPTTSPSGDSWEPWVLGVVLVAIVFLIIWNRHAIFGTSVAGAGVSISLPKAGGFWMALLTSFLVLATFFFLLSKIYPNAPLFNTDEGYWHIALYFLLGGLMAMVAANLKGKAWFVNFVLVVLMFAMIGHRTADLLDPSGKLGSKIAAAMPWNWGSSGQVASVGACSVSGEVPLDANEVVDLNPQNCDLKLAYPNQCLALRRADWTRDSTWYRVCDIPGRNTPAPNNIRYAYSNSPIVMFVQRHPH